MERLARIAVEHIRRRYEERRYGEYGKATCDQMYKDIDALLAAFDAAQTTLEGLEEKLRNPTQYLRGNDHDKAIITAVRLQLIKVVEGWRASGASVDQLIFRLKTIRIAIPRRGE